jgi:hypothetical protein
VAKKAKPTPIVYPTCARHAKSRKDVRLRHYFLCDGCAAQWVKEAFGGSASHYDGEKVNGYCLLCNHQREVQLRTWFLCDICHRVAGAIGRNHVAELAIVDFWDRHVRPLEPQLELVRNDISSLRPRRDTDESGTAPIDFLVRDTRTNTNLFGIENKIMAKWRGGALEGQSSPDSGVSTAPLSVAPPHLVGRNNALKDAFSTLPTRDR